MPESLDHPSRNYPSPLTQPRWIAVARLLRPQGRRGEILAEPLSDIAEIFSPGRELDVVSPQTGSSAKLPTVIRIESAWRPQGRKSGKLVLKLGGIDSISAAEQMQGAELRLREADMPALDKDTFLVQDLLGCTLWDGDRIMGTVTDLQFPIAADGRTRIADAPDLLVVSPLPSDLDSPPAILNPDPVPASSEEADVFPGTVLVPFVKAWLDRVDLRARELRMHLPPGLFD